MASNMLPPPPSQADISLTYADLVIQAILFLVVLFVAWRHGKRGMVCWPILATYFPLRFLADSWDIVHRHEPDIPDAVAIFTMAGCVTILSLGLIGAVFEANVIFPAMRNAKKGSWMNKGYLGVTHLFNTAGIALATYGGSPDESGGVMSAPLHKTGNCLMIAALLVTCVWLLYTYRLMSAAGRVTTDATYHTSRINAQRLLATSLVGMPFQLVRLGYSTAYAFDRKPHLDPYMGSFTTKFVFVFLMELAVMIILAVGGYLSSRNTSGQEKQRSEYAEEGEMLRAYSRSDESATCVPGSKQDSSR